MRPTKSPPTVNLSLWLRTNCFSSVHEQKSSQRQRQRTFLCIAKSLARFIALLPRRESFAIKINGQKLPPQFREIVCLVGACFARKRKIPILPWRNGQKIIYLFSLCEICSRKDILSLTQRKREKRRSASLFPFFIGFQIFFIAVWSADSVLCKKYSHKHLPLPQ